MCGGTIDVVVAVVSMVVVWLYVSVMGVVLVCGGGGRGNVGNGVVGVWHRNIQIFS